MLTFWVFIVLIVLSFLGGFAVGWKVFNRGRAGRGQRPGGADPFGEQQIADGIKSSSDELLIGIGDLGVSTAKIERSIQRTDTIKSAAERLRDILDPGN